MVIKIIQLNNIFRFGVVVNNVFKHPKEFGLKDALKNIRLKIRI